MKQRHHLTRANLEQRRNRVLELRLAGIPPTAMAAELRKNPIFANTRPDTVWNDIVWWEKRGELVKVDAETITKETYLDAQVALFSQRQSASKRFLVFNDQFIALAGELKEITEECCDADEARQQEITNRKIVIKGDLAELQGLVIRETRLILSITEILTDIPKKLGLIHDITEVGVHDITKEKMIEAIKDEKDLERKEELIRAAELFAGII